MIRRGIWFWILAVITGAMVAAMPADAAMGPLLSPHDIYETAALEKAGLPYPVFELAMTGYTTLSKQGEISSRPMLTVIDYSKPSTDKRLFVIDLKSSALKYHTWVAHGRNSGENQSQFFSNKAHSYMSSLGFYVTDRSPYEGKHGLSLRLDGKDNGFNDRARDRAIVIHGADYVSDSFIHERGRLGRSQGCPALPLDHYERIISAIADRTAVFAYFPNPDYLSRSVYVRTCALAKQLLSLLPRPYGRSLSFR